MSDRKLPDFILAELRETQERLEALADPENSRCGVDSKAKKEVQLFVRSWLIPSVSRIRQWGNGELSKKDWPYWGS